MNANTIHDDNATTWRDLADQLTPEQVERLEELEYDPDTLVRLTGNTDLRWTADALLSSARRCAGANLAGVLFFTGRPSVVASNWKSTAHTRFGASAVGGFGVVEVPSRLRRRPCGTRKPS